MRLRRALTVALSATALLAGTVVTAAPATAAPPGCSITGFSPREIVIGSAPDKTVQFKLKTNCPADADVNWYLIARRPDAPGPWGWLLLANFYQPPSSRFRYDPDGFASIPRGGNANAGVHNVYWQAFLGEETGVPEDYMRLESTITLKRATTFEGSFDATPEPVRRGQPITIKGTLQRADWDAPEYGPYYQGFAAPVALQFRATGATAYRTVKVLQTAADGTVTATVKATTSGTWRLRYLGDGVSGKSRSTEDFVQVTS
jgi:hypothetical protein